MLPWKETSVESERLRFIERVTAGEEPVTELCRAYGISRKTGYKLIHRYEAYGEDGLLDRSRAPHDHPNATPRELAKRIVEAKRAHPTWGPKKLIAWQGLERPTGPETRRALARAFQEYGLPQVIRTDNGPPFASVGLGSLSPLSAWWIKLGIVPERIEPGHPEQNGRLERLHRTFKAETASPPRANRRRQRRAFDHFRHSYNNERPHEALGQRPPVRLYTPSFRPYPSRLSSPEYGAEVSAPSAPQRRDQVEGGQSLCERVSSGRAHRPRPARRAHLVDTVRIPPHWRPRRPRAADRQDPGTRVTYVPGLTVTHVPGRTASSC